ncbi:6-phosphogluconolactonase [Clavulina sp. PMI_390]|nr:6-phosphogluconolactonase [Clavulina sp. PMI_390]
MPAHEAIAPFLYSFSDSTKLKESLAGYIIQAQTEALNKGKHKFSIAISGGSLPVQLSEIVKHRDVRDVQWDKWHIFFSDERAVPLTHLDSNYGLVEKEFLSNIPEEDRKKITVHTINESLLDETIEDHMGELADEYESQLIQSFAPKDSARFPVFDVILLGMGPDGHTASLFPGHALLSETTGWVVPIMDSPKPPAKRITLTLPVINHAARVVFVATGAGKQDTLKQVFDQPELSLPSSRVRPAYPGTVSWFVDDAASAKVEYPKTTFQLQASQLARV